MRGDIKLTSGKVAVHAVKAPNMTAISVTATSTTATTFAPRTSMLHLSVVN